MTQFDTGRQNGHDGCTGSLDCLDARDRRALEEHISVLPDIGKARDAPGMFVTVGENGGGEYLVDVETGSCTCPDFEYNLPDGDRTTCKHVAAARFATGEREIPAGVTRDDVRDDLAEHVHATPQFASEDPATPAATPAYTAADAPRLATDGGNVVETTPDARDETERPGECQCHPGWSDDTLPCFACWLDGFDTPNPDAPDDDPGGEVDR